MSSTLWTTIKRFDRTQLAPAMALRNALGVALPLAIGIALGNPSGGVVAATGALNVSFSDGKDPYAHRGRRMLTATLFVALAVVGGRLFGSHHALALLLEAACAFAAGLLVATGPTPGDIGGITLVTLIVFSASPATSAGKALTSGLLAAAGGVLQTVLSLALWPVHRYQPESRALASLYAELARSAANPAPPTEAPSATEPVVAARTALAALDSSRSVEAERYLALFSQAERMRLALLVLGRLHVRIRREAGADDQAKQLERALELTARVLHSISRALEEGVKGDPHTECLAELRQIAEHVRATCVENPTPALGGTLADARWQLDALTGQLASAVDLAAHTSKAGVQEFDRREAAQPWSLRLAGVVAVLGANLTLDSAACRHALRLAACVVLADALARSIGGQRAYWGPMTVAIVLKPDFTTTFSRGVLRLAGTFVGIGLATALFHAMALSAAWMAPWIALLVFVMRWAGPANYGVAVTALTSLVVLLFATTGVAPAEVMAARAVFTVVGGAIALAAYRVWPTWERTLVPEAIARLLDAYRSYFQAVRDAYLHPGMEHDPGFSARLDRARQAGRLARTTLEASIARLRLEPDAAAAPLTRLQAILANSHRFIHAVMSLEAGLFRSEPVPPRPALAVFANGVDATLYFLAAYLRGVEVHAGDLPDLREEHRLLLQSRASHAERYDLVNVETDRVTNSLNTLSVELIQWVSGAQPPAGSAV
ncbi:MAG: FUSC family protein [Candidatus Solibacter sp.]